MATQTNKPAFSGIIPSMVTSLLLDNLSLDVDGVKHLVEHLVSGGVHGIFILGTTGESTSLSYKTREQLIVESCKAVNGRVPVFVGITDTSIEESVHLALIAKNAGAAAVVAAPPYYYGLGQEELYKYYWSLADQASLPLFLYNMPSHTKINIDVKTVVRLSEHPNIVGVERQFGQCGFQRGHGVVGFGQLRFDIGQGFALFELGNALVHQLLVRGLRFGVFVPLFGQVFQFHGLSFRE